MNVSSPSRGKREADFFDALAGGASSAEAALPPADRNFPAMLSCLGDVRGRSILDVCCGLGHTSLWLAQAGARQVVGFDISGESIRYASRLAAQTGLSTRTRFLVHNAEEERPEWRQGFDRLFGAYALHHLDLRRALPVLAGYLRPGGRAVFLETSALNPMLRIARAHLPGRMGILRLGTPDEHPLTAADIRLVARYFGAARLTVGHYLFVGLLDRQIFRYRHPRISRWCETADRLAARWYPQGSYHIVLDCGPPSSHGSPK